MAWCSKTTLKAKNGLHIVHIYHSVLQHQGTDLSFPSHLHGCGGFLFAFNPQE